MKITIIHPCIGRRRGDKGYIRTWQMEPLPAATLAGLTPKDVEVRFYDDRMEEIPYDEKTDLVAMSVETYTAKRAYQIASEYRRRGVPVVMGGFHPSLCPDEVAKYADAVVTGEAEELWPRVLDDARHGTLEKFYRSTSRPPLVGLRPDRSPRIREKLIIYCHENILALSPSGRCVSPSRNGKGVIKSGMEPEVSR